MVAKKRKMPSLQSLLEREWCYYCERDFDDLKILCDHQKAKHFKCSRCPKRLQTANGLKVHTQQVHKEGIDEIANALPHRGDPNIEIFGTEGIPEDVMAAHKQAVTKEYYRILAEHGHSTGNPPAKSQKMDPGATNEPKPVESKESIKARAAEFRARKRAEKEARARGELVDVKMEDADTLPSHQQIPQYDLTEARKFLSSGMDCYFDHAPIRTSDEAMQAYYESHPFKGATNPYSHVPGLPQTSRDESPPPLIRQEGLVKVDLGSFKDLRTQELLQYGYIREAQVHEIAKTPGSKNDQLKASAKFLREQTRVPASWLQPKIQSLQIQSYAGTQSQIDSILAANNTPASTFDHTPGMQAYQPHLTRPPIDPAYNTYSPHGYPNMLNQGSASPDGGIPVTGDGLYQSGLEPPRASSPPPPLPAGHVSTLKPAPGLPKRPDFTLPEPDKSVYGEIHKGNNPYDAGNARPLPAHVPPPFARAQSTRTIAPLQGSPIAISRLGQWTAPHISTDPHQQYIDSIIKANEEKKWEKEAQKFHTPAPTASSSAAVAEPKFDRLVWNKQGGGIMKVSNQSALTQEIEREKDERGSRHSSSEPIDVPLRKTSNAGNEDLRIPSPEPVERTARNTRYLGLRIPSPVPVERTAHNSGYPPLRIPSPVPVERTASAKKKAKKEKKEVPTKLVVREGDVPPEQRRAVNRFLHRSFGQPSQLSSTRAGFTTTHQTNGAAVTGPADDIFDD
ncbi:hypothetical protein LTR37_006400 [Vermiconidia calcicola]|uniref:Uncharacterized protein n=1 Tax=Vermiconidia calcicola TaxID=1690605 RepID=A0ACC3NGP8_9PEZI|nr:hypothetical protein LTR37_006400 [Vermiconidia calcicola]